MIEIAKKYNHFDILKASGIYPDETIQHSKEDIADAVTKAYGINNFQLQCETDKNGRRLLSTIEICLDENYNPINCFYKDGIVGSCPKTGIYFPKKTN